MDTKTQKTLRYTNEIKTKMYSVQKIIDVGKLVQERFDSTELVDANWPQFGEVQFNQIQLRYRPQSELVINNLTLDIKAGSKVGIVGRTGAGKSTLGLTLSRILELEAGNILIDGVDIAKISLQDLRSKITVIPQDPTLFTGSLRFNLDPLCEHNDDAILNTLTKAGLGDLLQRNEGG